MISLLDNRFVNKLIHMQNCIAHMLLYYIYSDRFFVHCTALTKPVPDCRSSSFSDKLLNFTSALSHRNNRCIRLEQCCAEWSLCDIKVPAERFECIGSVAQVERAYCLQLDFIVIIMGRLILIVGRIFTGISQAKRYRPSLKWTVMSIW